MTLNNFSSVFEILAGINIALMLSDNFIISINKYFSESYLTLEKHIADIKDVMSNIRASIEDISEHNVVIRRTSDKGGHAQIEEKPLKDEKSFLIAKLIPFQRRLTMAENSIEQQKEISEISCKFKFICLYAGLYSILFLILSGILSEVNHNFVKNNSHIVLESIWAFNILSLILYFLYFIKDFTGENRIVSSLRQFTNWVLSDGYYRTFKHFLLILLISVVWFHIHVNWLENGIGICFVTNSMRYILLLSLLVGTIHYPYYFARALYTSRRDKKKFTTELNSIKSGLHDFNAAEVVQITHVSNYTKQK